MVFKKIKSKSNHYVLAVIPFFLMICACGGGEGSSSDAGSGEGTLSFQLVWENRPDLNAAQAAPSGDVCDDYNIETVAITVRDSSNVEVASANPSCNIHESTIGVPVGSDITVNVAGMVAGDADWQGQATGITVNKDQDTNLPAIIEMIYIGDDITPPTVLSNHSPPAGAANIALNPSITATFSEDVVAASVELEALSSCVVSETISGEMVSASVQYDSEPPVVTLVPDTLASNTDYTVTITTDVEDLAGWHMESDYSWNFSTATLYIWYLDNDGDGYGNSEDSMQATTQPDGYVLDNTDCDDDNNAVYPGAQETCNETDDNCNGQVDEGLSFDADGDGYTSIDSCQGSADDCDDDDESFNPAAYDVCNDNTDNDCDGQDCDCNPGLPSPNVVYLSSELLDSGSTRHRMEVTNRNDYPDKLFLPAPHLPPCGLNDNASRTWVEIYNYDTDEYIYGFCGFGSPSNLSSIWFATASGETIQYVYVVLRDRECNINHVSNPVFVESN